MNNFGNRISNGTLLNEWEPRAKKLFPPPFGKPP